MGSPKPILLSRALADLAARLESEPAAWSDARALLAQVGADPAEVADLADVIAAIERRDAAALGAILAGWGSGKRLLPAHDRALLQHAMKAFRKSLKLTRLDAESKIGGGPMSKGRESGIVGITPPPHYPREVWDELVRQGRLLRDRHGMVELPPE